MNEKQLEKLISDSIKSAPIYLWERIKNDIARNIADELLARLDGQKEPKKQESIDRVNALIALNIPKQYMKGA